jgi:hypothetical protein
MGTIRASGPTMECSHQEQKEYKGYKIEMQCRPLKNYTTTIPANRNITETQDTLVKYVFTGALYKYEQGAAYQGIAVALMEEEPRCCLFSFGI